MGRGWLRSLQAKNPPDPQSLPNVQLFLPERPRRWGRSLGFHQFIERGVTARLAAFRPWELAIREVPVGTLPVGILPFSADLVRTWNKELEDSVPRI